MAPPQHGRATSPSPAPASSLDIASTSQLNLDAMPSTSTSTLAQCHHDSKPSRPSPSASRTRPLRIRRALASLVIASTLACNEGLVQGATALAIPSRGVAGQDAQATSIAAGAAGKGQGGHEYQQAGQYGQRDERVRRQEDEEAPVLKVGKFTIDEGRPVPPATSSGETTKTRAAKAAASSSSTAQPSKSTSSSSSASSSTASLTPPAGRWGQSASYLAHNETILFIGGEVSNGSHTSLTNDVFALNVSSLLNNTTSGPVDPWQKLNSSGLPAHSFAASAVVASNSTEHVWLMGGETVGCEAAAAWTWTAGADMNSTWAAVNATNAQRKARAQAVQLPSSNNSSSSSFLVLGGRDVSANCSSSKAKRHYNAANISSSIWTLPTTTNSTSHRWALSAPQNRNVTVALGNGEFNMAEYSTSPLPWNNNATAFLGGLTTSGSYASLAKFWSYEPANATWTQVNTTGDIPMGRRGHTSTLLSDGRIAMIGGLLENGTYTDHVYLLNATASPAVWSKANYTAKGSMPAPAKAYHSTVRVGEVLVVAFGATNPTNSTAAIEERGESSNALASSLFYLDTASDGGWGWHDSIQGVLAARGVMYAAAKDPSAVKKTGDAEAADENGDSAAATASASASASTSPSASAQASPSIAASAAITASNSLKQAANVASPTVASPSATALSDATVSAPSASSTAAPEEDDASASVFPSADSATASMATGSELAPSASLPPSPSPSADGASSTEAASKDDQAVATAITSAASVATSSVATSNNNGDLNNYGPSSSSNATRNNAIAGSLLGAAALAAAIGGLYAYKSRCEAQKHGKEQADKEANAGGRGGDDGLTAPPVSALWFNNLRRKASRTGTNGRVDEPFAQGRIDPFRDPIGLTPNVMPAERLSFSVPQDHLPPRTLRDSLAATASPMGRFPDFVKAGMPNKFAKTPQDAIVPADGLVSPRLPAGGAIAAAAGAGAAGKRAASAPRPQPRAVSQRYLDLDFTPQQPSSSLSSPWATMADSNRSMEDVSDGEASHRSYPFLAAVPRGSESGASGYAPNTPSTLCNEITPSGYAAGGTPTFRDPFADSSNGKRRVSEPTSLSRSGSSVYSCPSADGEMANKRRRSFGVARKGSAFGYDATYLGVPASDDRRRSSAGRRGPLRVANPEEVLEEEETDAE
ncbi:hypothetical protein BDZ90DRAFT_261659 [Jaminaea rosea]|uniref:Galactose oxidase n=1 Tax=Jaminaea rosea TaxID=1569628 RepID=A0A316UMA1_9BASI|nr:hypothetical protein BDZ90DRAFT_261659 [Jaminaea rosea]PWN26350.1 hypothetical protein BDZ90DRAFT_261659 [Jaminaea rosea]